MVQTTDDDVADIPVDSVSSEESVEKELVLYSNEDEVLEPVVDTDEYKPNKLDSIIYHDRDDEITYGRRIQRYLTRKGYAWYNPSAQSYLENLAKIEEETEEPLSADEKQRLLGPSLDTAWAYFEHVALPRKLDKTRASTYDDINTCKAPPGIKWIQTELYPVLRTPQSQLGDFGIAIGIYFASMRYLMTTIFLGGLAYIPAMLYYASEKYKGNYEDKGKPLSLIVSAVCFNTTLVVCDDCDEKYFGDRLENSIIDNETYTFAKKNNCDGGTVSLAVNHLVVMVFVVACILLMGRYQSKKEEEFDEDNLTSSDYSVKISDPPADALDPQEWFEYFEKKLNAKAVYVTITLDNNELLKKLVDRRLIMHKLSMMLPPHLNLEDIDEVETAAAQLVQEEGSPPCWKRLLYFIGLADDAQMLVDKANKLDEEILELMQASSDYKASHVFVTLDTEVEQRKVLEKLTTGKFYALKDDKDALDDAFLFRGSCVLDVEEAGEPSDVRWLQLAHSLKERIIRFLLTNVPVLILIYCGALLVDEVRDENGPFWAGITISLLNAIVPLILRFVNTFERHNYETFHQASLYFKITLFRWMNTAVITTLTTSFTQTIEEDEFLEAVYGIFITEIITLPFLQVLDIMGIIKRHIIGPRCKNQFAMNVQFKGQKYNIAERFTNMTKVLFLVAWYSVIFPAGYILGAIALFVQYHADKFCLLRVWTQQPPIGRAIGRFGRLIFYPLALCVMSVIISYFWAGFPYDNLCEIKVNEELEDLRSKYSPENLENLDPKISFNPNDNDSYYKFCSQDFLGRPNSDENNRFPVFSREDDKISKGGWMTDDQAEMANYITAFGLAVFVLSFQRFFRKVLLPIWRYWAHDTYSTKELTSDKSFFENRTISCYTPEVHHPKFDYPFLACDVERIEERHIDWEDPHHNYSFYSLYVDALHINKITKESIPEENIRKSFATVTKVSD